jgi:hypothetical protein
MHLQPDRPTTPIGRLASLSRVLHPPGEPADLITSPPRPPSEGADDDEAWDWR